MRFETDHFVQNLNKSSIPLKIITLSDLDFQTDYCQKSVNL